MAVRKPALEIKLTAGSMYLKTQADIQEHAGDWPTDFSHYIKPGVEYRYIDFFADESWINGGFCVVVFYGKKDGSPELAFDRVLLDIKNMVVNSDAIQN